VSRSADVVVVGGGAIGCAVAYYTARRGLRVTLLDQARRGRATSASAGGLWPVGESVGLGCGVIVHKARHAAGRAPDAPTALPPHFVAFARRSNAMFPGLAAELFEATGIDVEWERTSLLFLLFDDGDESFARSLRARGPVGAEMPAWLDADELARAEPAVSRRARGALRFEGDDQVNPYRLADALRAAACKLGATFLSRAEATGLEVRDGRVVAVATPAGRITCDMVVNAAGAWAAKLGRLAGLELPVRPVRGQIVGTEPLPKLLSACLSTADCYLLQKGHGEVLVGSTTEEAGFEVGVTPQALHALAVGAVRAVPGLESVQVKRAWSGLRPGTPDELPILGPVAGLDGYLNACGHFRTGIVNAPLTGAVVAELAAGVAPSFPIGPFLASRFGGASS
jgi:glycine/D-amino acid oxidase-like deaminating enzyme